MFNWLHSAVACVWSMLMALYAAMFQDGLRLVYVKFRGISEAEICASLTTLPAHLWSELHQAVCSSLIDDQVGMFVRCLGVVMATYCMYKCIDHVIKK